MQTIKTAAVAVLLMTVVYGAYISLTTPPEPLPADVEDMLVMGDDSSRSMESMLPPSLAELGISNGTSLGEPQVNLLAQPDTLAASTNPNAAINTATALNTAPALPASSSGVPADFVSATMPSMPSAPTVPIAAPKSTGPAGYQTTLSDSPTEASSTPSSPGYQSTNQTFQMPDPSLLNDPEVTNDNTSKSISMGMTDLGSSAVSQVASITASQPNLGLVNAIRTADGQYQSDQRREALSTLSIFYNVPDLTGEQRSELLSRLDPLAASVIYSSEHLLERPYRVARSETLMEIAERYEVPWQLLANINQITDPVTIIPGTELKVVRGPFRAEVDLSDKEMTLFLGDLYAGRFPIGTGNDPAPKPGTYTVQDKQTSRTFYDPSGAPVAPGSPQNPYGNAWIDLGGQFSIHGSPSTTEPSDRGCISLAADLADDLYGILSQGSTVMIRE